MFFGYIFVTDNQFKQSNMKKIYNSLRAVFALLALFSSTAFGQQFNGYNYTDYAGVYGMFYNPASIADSRFLTDLNFVGGGFNVYNNVAGVNAKALFRPSLFEEADFVKNNMVFNTDNRRNNFGIRADIFGPSFMAMLSQRWAFGIGTRVRLGVIGNNLPQDLLDIGASVYFDSLDIYQNRNLTANQMRLAANGWAEYSLSLAYVIKPKGKHFMKVGITPKLIQGLAGAYTYINNGTVNYNDSLMSASGQFGYGRSDIFNTDFSNIDQSSLSFFDRISFGLDLGFVYEWRPNAPDDEFIDPSTKDKYKLRLSASILDIGSVRYKNNFANDFSPNFTNWNFTNLNDFNSGTDVDTLLQNQFNGTASVQDNYRVALPTSFLINADYKVHKRVGLNLNAFIALNNVESQNLINNLTNVTFTPSYEFDYMGIYLPQMVNAFGKYYSGVTLRLGPFVVGSNTVVSQLLMGSRKTFGADVHLGFRIPIYYKWQNDKKERKPSDADGDGVVDLEDGCPNLAGPVDNKGCPYGDRDADGTYDKDDACPDEAGLRDLQGCPDRDDDKVRDKDDKCPDVKGLVDLQGCPDRDNDGVADTDDTCPDNAGDKAHKGCPDTDGDGIYDDEDKCKEVKGVRENMGCPDDRDGDGVKDKDDACPDVKGLISNNGCPESDRDGDGIKDKEDACPDKKGPFENKGCPYTDTDNDGVLDKDDKCINTPGPATNQGCPEIAKEEQEVLDYAFANLEFESGKAIIRATSYESLNKLADLLVKKPNYKLLISGHTDNVGQPAANMTLSKNRANAVKTYLTNKGVAASRLTAEWFGQTKPIAPNTTPEGKQRNRRVEMKVVFD